MTDATTIATFAQQMIAAGEMFHARGWVPATGGNFSVRLDAEQVLITASGNHKGELREEHFLVATLDGKPLDQFISGGRKASYETLLHMQIYRRVPEAKAVLHVHTTANTLLSRRFEQIALTNYELLKVLPGTPDPQAEVIIPVFGNDQNIARLSATVDAHMVKLPATPAYLIAGHGLYAWGRDVAEARHRVEAIEFMLECHLRELSL
ncbi:MAG: methylthioribulose 1-phosphate dehydratase [Pseudomonadota bacterium]